jgi:hypothetical protein
MVAYLQYDFLPSAIYLYFVYPILSKIPIRVVISGFSRQKSV